MSEGVTGVVVHDFWRPYFTLSGVLHALCNTHHLRELKALIENENEPWALGRCSVFCATPATLPTSRDDRIEV